MISSCLLLFLYLVVGHNEETNSKILLLLGRQNHVILGDISSSREPSAMVFSPFILSEILVK